MFVKALTFNTSKRSLRKSIQRNFSVASSVNLSKQGSGSVKKIALIPADGVGKEVVPEAVRVLEEAINHNSKMRNKLEYITLDAGWETFESQGTSLPKKTVETLKNECCGALFGSVQSPSHKVEGYSSPIVAMRNLLDLYANLRPIVSTEAGINQSRENVDMLIVRENTECLYVKKERLLNNGEMAIADRVITRKASTRIAEMAFKQAMQRKQYNQEKGRASRVTIVHKSNVLSVSDGLFRESCLAVAEKYPSIEVEEQLVDSMVYKMFLNPEHYDVVVAPNLYGDILSDAGAALVGGLGLVPSANVGESFCLAEPVHGSAPDIAGKNIANPIATIRAAAMLLRQLYEQDPDNSENYGHAAQAIENACSQVLSDPKCRSKDLGGNASTNQVTDSIIERVKRQL